MADPLPELAHLAAVLPNFGRTAPTEIDACFSALRQTFTAGGKLLVCGNGGSAADSQHLAAELVSSFAMGLERPALPAIALTTDSSVITAYANDHGFAGVFARQVEALGRPGDCLLAISTSGTSANVLEAVTEARSKGMTVLSLTGALPNTLAAVSDHYVAVPSRDTQLIQTLHLVAEHALCRLLEESFERGEWNVG